MGNRRVGARASWWLAVLGIAGLMLAPAGPARADTGTEIYLNRCAGCHGEKGEGRGSFPTLAGNPALADSASVENVVRSGKGYMPSFAQLSDQEIAAVVQYVTSTFAPVTATTTGGVGPGAQTPPTTSPGAGSRPAGETAGPGDAARGEAYFWGRQRFERGGAPCVACHTAARAGGIAGGTLASDLTGVAARLGGEAGVAGALNQPAFPVMRAAYTDKGLTAQERADLGAFFATLSGKGGGSGWRDRFWLWGGLGTIVLFIVLGLGWPRHKTTAVERLHMMQQRDTKVGSRSHGRWE